MSDQETVATPEDEAATVQGLETAERHPDNGEGFEEPELTPDEGGEEAVGDDDLAAAVAEVDADDVDEVGHDDGDLTIGSFTGDTVPAELAGLPDPDDVLPVS